MNAKRSDTSSVPAHRSATSTMASLAMSQVPARIRISALRSVERSVNRRSSTLTHEICEIPNEYDIIVRIVRAVAITKCPTRQSAIDTIVISIVSHQRTCASLLCCGVGNPVSKSTGNVRLVLVSRDPSWLPREECKTFFSRGHLGSPSRFVTIEDRRVHLER